MVFVQSNPSSGTSAENLGLFFTYFPKCGILKNYEKLVKVISSGEDPEIHSFRVEKIPKCTRFEWRRSRNTLVSSVFFRLKFEERKFLSIQIELLKKNSTMFLTGTLHSFLSGEDVKLHSFSSGEDVFTTSNPRSSCIGKSKTTFSNLELVDRGITINKVINGSSVFFTLVFECTLTLFRVSIFFCGNLEN